MAAIATGSKVMVGKPCVAVTVPVVINGGEIHEHSKRLKLHRLDSRTILQARFTRVGAKEIGNLGTQPLISLYMSAKATHSSPWRYLVIRLWPERAWILRLGFMPWECTRVLPATLGPCTEGASFSKPM